MCKGLRPSWLPPNKFIIIPFNDVCALTLTNIENSPKLMFVDSPQLTLRDLPQVTLEGLALSYA